MGVKKMTKRSLRHRSLSKKLSDRKLLLETLERRELLAGPDLLAIRPDSSGLLASGDTLNIAPREFNLLFAGGADIDESSIGSDTVRLTRAGDDGRLGTADDINVALGFVGLVNPGSTDPADLAHLVLRPASSAAFNVNDATNQFPDDEYQIQIVGAGAAPLMSRTGVAFNGGVDEAINFVLDRGAQIVSVVPQPITRTGSGLSQSRNTIEVYFDDQQLVKADAENVNFYRLYNAVTQTPATNPTPTSVAYSALDNRATLTFATDIPEGTYRLDIGQSNDRNVVIDDRGVLGTNDTSISFDTAISLGTVNVGGFADRTIKVAGRIEPQSIALPPLPGGEDDPGHRVIQREAHIGSTGTTPRVPVAIHTVQYHFPVVLGTFDAGGGPGTGQYLNLITETEKQIVRDILEIYARESGLEFIEGLAGGSLSIGKGDLRALDPNIGPNSGVAGLGGAGNVVLNGASFTDSDRFYGDGFSVVMYHEIGHALGLGHSYDQPSVQGTGPVPNEVLPGDADLLHLRRISPPNSTDIDVYSFTLPSSGRFSAEVFAERLATPSLLNSALTLFKSDPVTGQRTVVARNDQYFGADAFLDLELEAGTYFIGISSTGNTSYDLNVPNSGFGGTTDGLYELIVNFKPVAATEMRDTRGTALDGDANGTPGGVYQFWFQSATPANTFIVDKLADTNTANTNQGLGTIASPFESLRQAVVAGTARPGTAASPTIIRIVGNGGADGDIDTIADNRPYLIGTTVGGAALPDGAEFRVPAGVNVMLDAGTLIKMRKANIDAGSTAAGINRAGGSIQVLGTPTHSVFLRSYHDDTVGGNSDLGTITPSPGDYGGIVFRDDSDRESNGIFLNYVNHADIKHGGGKVFVDSSELQFTSIHITNARPTVSFNLITESSTAAISASPDSFDDSLRRIGPDIHGNYLVSNSVNGLAIRIDTPSGTGLTKLQVSGRFNDTDITHVLSENLVIGGGSGGPVRNAGGTLIARPAGRLQIDPGVVVKLNRARIEVERGAGTLIAEGTVDRPIVFTAQNDKRFGGSGSFDTNQSPTTLPQPGAWSGLFFGEGTSGSIDHSIVTFGGGNSGIEGSDFAFNALEIHQADVRVVNSLFQNNAAATSTSTNRRNGRGSNGLATIYVRGAQPIIVNNDLTDNEGSAISINANSFVADIVRDYGRATGPAEAYSLHDDNYGPLVRLNRLENNGVVSTSVAAGSVNGMLVRGEEVTVESVWDDTDIVHVLQDEVRVDNLHSLGGLTLQSSNSESLVVKLRNVDTNGDGVINNQDEPAGFTATGTGAEIIDRIGGTIHVLGTIGHPVIFTSLNDDSVGAGFDPSGKPNRNTNNSPTPSAGAPGDWRGLLFDEFSNDRNVAIVRELESPLTNKLNVNGTPSVAQNIGVLAPNLLNQAPPYQKSGDDNRRLGFEIHGFISPDDGSDTDVYSFTGTNGTPVWIDIDRTDSTLDAVVEIIDATTGAMIASSDAPESFSGPGASTMTRNLLLGGDYYTQNHRDPGFYFVLNQPGAPVGSEGTFFIRVSSRTATPGNAQSRGKYMLQIRTQQVDEFPGSTVRYSDIRFAATGIDVRGLPAHSPLLGEAGEVNAPNDTFATAQTLVNLLQTDVAAIGLSGSLSSPVDADWYQFELTQTGVQAIGGGVNDNAGTIAVVFDIDYADGAVSADTTIAVYDDNQRLVFIGRESNIQDDQRLPGDTSINDLTRGTLDKKDSYIGPIHLTPALAPLTSRRYYVAVMSNRQQPSALNGVFQSAVNDATAQVRLEPVNSVTRIVEDHIGFQGYSSNGVTVTPTTSGGLFNINNAASLSTHVAAMTLSGVTLYVATDVVGQTGNAGANDSLYTYNPLTGGPVVTRVSNNLSSSPLAPGGFDDVQDIVMRSDGRLFGYVRLQNDPAAVGALVELNPEPDATNGQIISVQKDNIEGPSPMTPAAPPAGTTPNVASTASFSNAIINNTTRLTRFNEFATSNEVDAFTFQRTGTTGPATAPVPTYDTLYVVRESQDLDTSSSALYRGTQAGDANTAITGGTFYGKVGDIQPAGVTYAVRTLWVANIPQPGGTLNFTRIRIESKIAGEAGNFTLTPSGAVGNGASVTSATPTNLSLVIGDASSAGAIVDAINNSVQANRYYTAVIYDGNSNNQGDGTPGNPTEQFTVTTPPPAPGFITARFPNYPTYYVEGSDGTDPYGPLQGRVTGISFGDFDSAANDTLYGVTNAGEFLIIDSTSGVVTQVVDVGDSIGVPGLKFQGLTLGPQNVEGGAHKNTLFAITEDGQVVAFDLTGNGVVTFDTNTQSQVITVSGGGPNDGFFALTTDNDSGGTLPRLTTVPIQYNAPATITANEMQTFDTDADDGTFTLSFVDNHGAVTSPSAPMTLLTTNIQVQSKQDFPTTFPFLIQVDNEQMRVTGNSGPLSYTVVRGLNAGAPSFTGGNLTAATTHTDTATVFEVVQAHLNDAAVTTPYSTTVMTAIDAASGLLNVANASGFPTAPFTIRVDDEEMLVTNVIGNDLTVARNQNGTPNVPHSAGRSVTVVSQRITVYDTTPFATTPATVRLRIDDEYLRVVGIVNGTQIDVIRGDLGTTPVSHAFNSEVFRLDTTGPLAYNATAAQIESALQLLPGIGAGNAIVTGGDPGTSRLSGFQSDPLLTTPVTVEFVGPQLAFNAGLRGLRGVDVMPLVVNFKGPGASGLIGDEIQSLGFAPALIPGADPDINDGVFQLRFNGFDTADIRFDATAAEVQAALEALPSIGAGNVRVSLVSPLPVGPLNIQFINELQDQDVAQIQTAPTSTVRNEIKELRYVTAPIGGSFRLTLANPDKNINPITGAGNQTGPIAYNATAGTIRNALVAAYPGLRDTVNAIDNIVVTGGPLHLNPVRIEFVNELAGLEIEDLLVTTAAFNPGPTVLNSTTPQTVIGPVNQQQTIEFSVAPTGGMFNIVFNDIANGLVGTTADINFDATAADIRDAIVNLFPTLSDTFGAATVDNLIVTRPAVTDDITIEFVVDLAGVSVAAITVDDTNLTGGVTASASITRAGVNSLRLSEIQQINQTGTAATGGSFQLEINDPINQIVGISDPIPWNATALQALNAIQNGIPALFGHIDVQGGQFPGNPLTIEFRNKFAGLDVHKFTVVNALTPTPNTTATVTTIRNTAPPASRNEIQQIVNTANPVTGGQYFLTINDVANNIVGTSAQLNFAAGAAAIQNALIAGIPALAGNISVTGAQLNSTTNPITIEFINQLAFTNVSPITVAPNPTSNYAPGNAAFTTTTIQFSVSSAIRNVRQGRGVDAVVATDADGNLSVFDALDLVVGPTGASVYDASNIRVAGNLETPPNVGTTVTYIGALASAPVAVMVPNSFLMNNGAVANVTAASGSGIDGSADSFITTITGYTANGQVPVGLAFSPLDFNLWHPTTRRATDVGHGINSAPDDSRSPGRVDRLYSTANGPDRVFTEAQGGASLYFGLEPWVATTQINSGSQNYLAYNGINAQYGILNESIHRDLSTNPKLVNTYDVPGGASGALHTNTFDLANTVSADRPTLYFSYFLDTENHPGSNINSDGTDPFRDSARVWAKRQGSTVWELLATNNSTLSVPNVNNVAGTAELGNFLSHLSDAGLASTPPRPVTHQIRQELFDSTGQWRQARVDLSTFAGETGIELRFDFSTSGTFNDPNLGSVDANFGEFSSGTRSIRSTNNGFEGFYIDDIIIGYAERGEMVTGSSSDPNITDLNGSDRTRNDAPNPTALILNGPYQLEVRRTGEYEAYLPASGLTSVGITYNTNDRHIIELNEVNHIDFEVTPPGSTFLQPWAVSSTRPETLTMSHESGNVSLANPLSVYQVTTNQLGGSASQTGVVEFSFSVSSDPGRGLRFFINGVAQNLVASDPDFPGAATPTLATGELPYQTVRYNLPSGNHTLQWVFDYGADPTAPLTINKAFIDNLKLLQGGTGLLGDLNREREQGQFVIEANFISDSLARGINVQPGAAQGSGGGVSHPGSLINYPQVNSNRLIPGVVIANNVIVGDSTGIRFAGEPITDPQRPVPFGRIINNTLVGTTDPVTGAQVGIGVQLVGISSPTLLNNLFTNLATSIVNSSTAAGNGSEAPIIRSNFFQNNGNNPALGTAFIDAGNSGSPFVDATNRNFYPSATSSAIDSGQDNEQDRGAYKTFKLELGIPESAIIAPSRDVYGQLRVDSSGSTTGGGSSVFIDRGAVDRSDKDSPFAVLLNPIDNDSVDRDPNETVVHLTDPLLENFKILLGDGRGPNSPFEGTGVDGLTVDDASDPTIAESSVQLVHNGRLLQQGVDYNLGYNTLTGVLLLSPIATLWDPTGVYAITLDNSQIKDRAGRTLRPNQSDQSTRFFILMPDVSLDYGDANNSFQTLLASNGARHTIQPGATPRLGARVDGERDGFVPVSSDDDPKSVTITSPTSSPLFTITSTPTEQSVLVDSTVALVGGEQLRVQIGDDVATFELVAPGFAADNGNVAVTLESTDSATTVATKLADAIQSKLVFDGDSTAVTLSTATIAIETFDDEDGVSIGRFNDGTSDFIVFLNPGASSNTTDPSDVQGFLNPLDTLGTTISVTAGVAGLLDAWIDFNGNDVFDLTEQIFANTPLAVGVNTLQIQAPAGSPDGIRWARFRISETGNLGPAELAIGGEVEDYQVQIVNVAPTVPQLDSFTVLEDGVLNTESNLALPTVFANDPVVGFLPPRMFVIDQPQNGTLTVTDPMTGRFVYEPNDDFYGEDTFTYRVSTRPAPDDVAPATFDVATVVITVSPVNDAPLAQDRTLQAVEDTELTISPADLLVGAVQHLDPQYVDPSGATFPWDETNQSLIVDSLEIDGVFVDSSNAAAGPFTTARGSFVVVFAGDALDHIRYTPSQDLNRDNDRGTGSGLLDSFKFTVRDSGESLLPITNAAVGGLANALTSAQATAFIDVAPTNDPPVAVDDVISENNAGWNSFITGLGLSQRVPTEDTDLVIPQAYLLQNDFRARVSASDERAGLNDGAMVVDSVSTSTLGGIVSIVNGDVVYQPPANAFGLDTFTYRIKDSGVNEDASGNRAPGELTSLLEATVTILVKPVNDAPSSFDRQFTLIEAQEFLDGTNATDTSALSEGVGMKTVLAAELLNGTSGNAAPATFTGTYDENEQSLRIAGFGLPGDTQPRVKASDLTYDAAGNANASISSPHGTLELTFAKDLLDSNDTGALVSFVYTPNIDYNSASPFPATDDFVYFVEDFGEITVSSDTATLTAIGESGTSVGHGSKLSAPATIAFTVTPVNDVPVFPAFDPVEIDEDQGVDNAPVIVNIYPAPVSVKIFPGSGSAQDESATQLASVSVTLVRAPQGLFSAPPTLGVDGTLTLHPNPDAFGIAVYSVTVTETALDGSALVGAKSVTRELTITVNPVNDAPTSPTRTFAPVEAIQADGETGLFTFSANDLLRLGQPDAAKSGDFAAGLSSLYDESEQTLHVVGFKVPGAADVDVSSLASNGGSGTITRTTLNNAVLSFTFDAGKFTSGTYLPPVDYNQLSPSPFTADDAFSYLVEDDGKSTIPGSLETNGATEIRTLPAGVSSAGNVSVIVEPSNDPPQLDVIPQIQYIARADDGEVVIEGFATNILAGPPTALDELAPNQSVTITYNAGLSTGVDGLFRLDPVVDSDGRLTLYPASQAFGNATVVFDVTDSSPTPGFVPRTIRVSFTLEVLAVVASPDLIESSIVNGVNQKNVNEDDVVVVQASKLLENDNDPASGVDPTGRLSLVLQSTPTTALGGSVSYDPVTMTVSYDPRGSQVLQALKVGETMDDTFTYQARDLAGATSAPVVVTVRVEGINDAATVSNDSITVSRTGSTVLNILDNDIDVDGTLDPASILITQQPTGGTLNFEEDGTLTYTPDPGFTGTDSFRYTVGDDLGQQSEQALVTIAGNNAPFSGVDDLTVRSSGGPTDLDVLSNDTLFDGALFDLTSLTIVTPPTGGTAVPQPDGTVRYTPNTGFFGADFFEYTITDTLGRVSAPSRVDLTVTAPGSQNPVTFQDVDASGEVTALDALIIINRLNLAGNAVSIPIDPLEPTPPYYDVNGDGFISASDALDVINELTRLDSLGVNSGQGEGEFLLSDASNPAIISAQLSFNPTPITPTALAKRTEEFADAMVGLANADQSLTQSDATGSERETDLIDLIDLIVSDSSESVSEEASDAHDWLFADFDNLS